MRDAHCGVIQLMQSKTKQNGNQGGFKTVRARWWLIFIGLLLGSAVMAQTTPPEQAGLDPYKDKQGRHVLPNARPRAIPQQNYRVAPSHAPWSGNPNLRKEGLNQGRVKFETRQQRTRGPRQDRDITQAITDELHPIYAPGAARMYFVSNATQVDNNGKLAVPGAAYHIWRGDLDDGNSSIPDATLANLTRITGDVPEEANGDQIHPSLNTAANILAYASRPAAGTGSYNIIIRNLTTGQRIQLTTDNNNVIQNTRPSLSPGGNLVAFASNRQHDPNIPRDGRWRIFLARTDGRAFDDGVFFRPITFPADGFNDVEPAWSPDGNSIAFSRLQGSPANPVQGSIYLVNVDTRVEARWTNYPNAIDRQPAWEQNNQQFAFSSNRKPLNDQVGSPPDGVATRTNIFRIPTVLPEDPDNSTALSVTNLTDEDPLPGAEFPTSAITVRNRVAYQSNRRGTVGTFNPSLGRIPHDIWESLIFDVTPPTLEVLPIITPKEVFPGDNIKVKVKVTDFQSGIDFVRVQFKDPDSAEQDAESLEHKLYILFQFDIFFPNRILVNQGNAYVPLFVEIGQQAINPNNYEYKDPYSLRPFGFAGSLDDTLLLEPVTDEPDWYEVTWRTPTGAPSDFYVDIIVRDSTGNEYVYDNISGFTSKRFTGANNILLVSDYMSGQIFVQTRGAPIGDSVSRPTWAPVESYWTDNPTGKPPFDVTQPPSGTGLTIFGDGAIPHPNVLGAFIRSDTLGENTTYGDFYDIWRVQCRNPINPSVLSGYLPRYEQEPTDLNGGFRQKLVSERTVFWGSPYTGNVWSEKGNLLDPEVQTLLRTFLSGGGRLLVSGQDVAWALALQGGISNDFLQQAMRVTYDSDTAEDVFLTAFQALRHTLTEVTPTTGDPNPIARNPGGLGIWIRYEGNTIVPDPPTDLRLSNPGLLQITQAGVLQFFDVIVHAGAGTGPLFTDGAWNQVWIDTVTVDPVDRAPYRYTAIGQLGTSDRAGFYYENATNRSKVAFFAFGLEGANSTYNDGPPGLMWSRAYRNKVLHNAVCWMTTATIQGIVQAYDPDSQTLQPSPRTLVRAVGVAPGSIAGVSAGFAITDSTGFYRIVGLEAGVYLVDAERPGFKTQHPESTAVCGDTSVINLIMLQTPPGQIAGRVVDVNAQPVRNAVITATNQTDPQLTKEVITDPDGTFLLTRVQVGEWSVTVTSVEGYSLPPILPQPDGVFRDVQVAAGQTTQLSEDFVVEPLPGILKGRVTDVETTDPIANAQITVRAGTTVRATTTTDPGGNYSVEVPGGEYDVTASYPGYADGTQRVIILPEGEVTQDFELAKLPPGSIVGRVIRKLDNTPEPGATATLTFLNQTFGTATTNASGQYSFVDVPPGTYTVTITKSGFTITGGASGTPNQRTVVVSPNAQTSVPDFFSEPLRTFVKGRTLVSAPYTYATDITELLGITQADVQARRFRFFTWDPAALLYVFYPTAPAQKFETGRGYFLETANNLALSVEGTPADENVDYEIPLQQGWNLIGDPFKFNIEWTGVAVRDGATRLSYSQAVANGIIANSLWGYAFGQYSVAFTLETWRGYWVYAYRATTLLIPPGARSRSAVSRAVPSPQNGWRLALSVHAGDLSDQVYIGTSRSATEGFDNEHDLLKPPPIGEEYLYVSMPRPDWGSSSGVYGVDIRPHGRASGWEFVVQSSEPNREISLRWPNIQQLPRSVNPVLIDLQTNERRYLRTSGSYTFRASQGGTSRFRIEMASSAGLLRITNVQVNGGRSTGNNHTIAFAMTRDAQVEVNILSNGRVVRNVVSRVSRSAGVQQVTWDGRDRNSIAMPPGQYTVEIKATSPDGQTARSIVPVVLTR